MRIEGPKHIVDHPEDDLAAPALTKVIELGCVAHLLDGQFAGSNERFKEVEVVSATGLYHRHRRQREIYLMSDVRGMRFKGLEGITEDVVPFHRLARNY
jgi:hypothetical protein